MRQRSRQLALILSLLVVSSLLFAAPPLPTAARAQEAAAPQDPPSGPIVRRAVAFAVTPALDEIEADGEPVESFRRGKVEMNAEREEEVITPPPSGATDPEQIQQAAIQSSADAPNLAANPTSFEGVSSDDNARVLAFRVSPPDTVGDIGPTQYVQAVNLLFRVFDKATGAPLTAAQPISVLFDSLPAGSRCRRRDDGDPIVLYDGFANRWLISQFVSPDTTPSPQNEPPYAQCIAISRTSDATGGYFVYEFTSPNNKFGDYPKYGVWPDAYYSTVNQFVGSFRGVGVYAYDREKMLRGDPTATYIYFDLEGIFSGQTPRGMLPSDADGLLPPPAGAPNVFTYFNANEFTGETDSLRLFDFHADFANPANSTFTERPESPLPVAPFDPRNPPGADDVEQPPPAPTNAYLDAIGDRLMNRFQYRNFGSFEAWAVNHTVNATPTTGTPNFTQYRAAPRYYELRRAPGASFAVQNQGTFSPDANDRWMGSAALDNQGNLGLGYSVSSTTVFPSIRYTGRLATDPPNTLQAEQTIHSGTGVQTNAGSRWGDYSSLNVDPTDDCTFYYTQEYYQIADRTPTTPPRGVNWQTRVGSFKFAQCTAPAQGTLNVNVRSCLSGAPVSGASVSVDGNLIGTTGANGVFSANLPPGAYTASISAPGFPAPVSQTVTITAGQTATFEPCLVPAPHLVVQSVTLASESCSPGNGAVDPGETVTVNVTLRNDGTAPVSNLIATLQASGGVTLPSGSQNFGALAPGQSATRQFTFTAGSLACGGDLTLTFRLQDGATDLGAAAFTLALGSLSTGTLFTENFDGVTPPALPPGWTTSVTGTPPATPTPTPAPPAPWFTTTAFSATPPNSAATTDNPYPSSSTLVSPAVAIPAATGPGSVARLSFANFYNLEPSFDGGVLEISIGGAPFQDIIAAGGVFESGGYDVSLFAGTGNPLAGRPAWTGNSGHFITTTVRLPAAAAGQSVRFRWVMGTDALVEVANGGWRIDNVSVTAGARVCCVGGGSGTPQPAVSIAGRVLDAAGAGVAGVTVTLSGPQTGVTQTDAGGRYAFDNVPASGTHTVTPASGGAAFAPQSLTYANPAWNQIGNFVAAPPGVNAIDTPGFFIAQHYADFLGREPDQAGFDAWVSLLNRCPNRFNDPTCDRVTVSAAFFGSPEFQARGGFAIRFFIAAFGRLPTFREFIAAMSDLGGATDAEALANRARFPDYFVEREEFGKLFGALSNEAYVDRLVANTGVPITNRNQLVADLNAGTKTRAQVLREIVGNASFAQATFNRTFVLMQYFGYLRRDPEPAGFQAWLDYLTASPTDFRTMVRGFVDSVEYRRRFGAN